MLSVTSGAFVSELHASVTTSAIPINIPLRIFMNSSSPCGRSLTDAPFRHDSSTSILSYETHSSHQLQDVDAAQPSLKWNRRTHSGFHLEATANSPTPKTFASDILMRVDEVSRSR